MVAPMDVVVWAMLGGLVAVLLNLDRGESCFWSRAPGLIRVLVVCTLYGIALSALALTLAPFWTATSLLHDSDRWALAFVIAAISHKVGPLALCILRALVHDQANKIR